MLDHLLIFVFPCVCQLGLIGQYLSFLLILVTSVLFQLLCADMQVTVFVNWPKHDTKDTKLKMLGHKAGNVFLHDCSWQSKL